MGLAFSRSTRTLCFACTTVVLFLSLTACRNQADQLPVAPTSADPPTPTPIPRRKRHKPRADQPSDTTANTVSSSEGNALLGNPSKAAKDPNNYLLERSQYTMSFNHSHGEPNWVAWHVDSSNIGDSGRGKFQPDPDLPADWQIVPSDYTGSGYDRGHVCPSGDRTASREENDGTFYMSNMLPQTGALNRHLWEKLESYDRGLVGAGNEIYQVAGGIGNAATIADGKVVVPQSCWKIVVVLPLGTGDLNRITADTRVIAVNMPNIDDTKLNTEPWSDYLTTVKDIETKTGLKFFTALPPKVRQALETKKDTGDG